MNAITHFLIGFIITSIVWGKFSKEWAQKREWPTQEIFKIRKHSVIKVSLLRVVVTSVGAYFSHILIDGFAIFTYHPWKDHGILFNQIWTPIIILTTIFIAIYALKRDIRYSWGLVFSVMFDVWDYGVIRVIKVLKPAFDLNFLLMHQMEWWFIDTFLSWAPNFYQKPIAALVEIAIILIFFKVWMFLAKKWPLSEKKEIQPNLKEFIKIVVILALIWFGTLILTYLSAWMYLG